MRPTTIAIIILLLTTLIAPVRLLAQSDPDVIKILEQREHKLDRCAYYWRVADQRFDPAQDSRETERILAKAPAQVRALCQEQGITDPAVVQQMIATRKKFIQESRKAAAYRTDDTWVFTSYDNKVSVSGTCLTGPKVDGRYQEYFGDHIQVISCSAVWDPGREGAGSGTSQITSSPGDGFRYFDPYRGGLSVRPEDFAMLIGKNPLAMFGANWRLTARNSSAITFHGDPMSGSSHLYAEDITLDLRHGDAPQLINYSSPAGHGTYHALQFRQFRGEWLPSRLSFNFSTENGERWQRDWKLIEVHGSQPVALNLPHRAYMLDYRLLGQNASPLTLNAAVAQQSPDIIAFRWMGYLPTRGQLLSIKKINLSGKSQQSDLPARILIAVASTILLAGVILLLLRQSRTVSRKPAA